MLIKGLCWMRMGTWINLSTNDDDNLGLTVLSNQSFSHSFLSNELGPTFLITKHYSLPNMFFATSQRQFKVFWQGNKLLSIFFRKLSKRSILNSALHLYTQIMHSYSLQNGYVVWLTFLLLKNQTLLFHEAAIVTECLILNMFFRQILDWSCFFALEY